MKNHQDNANAQPALLHAASGVNTLETNSLCCAAAGIIAPSSATAEALIPHEKLRGAALADATLNAQARPLAQPVKGYTHLSLFSPTAQEQAVISAPCVWASSLREAMENTAASGKRCALTIGDTLLQVSYHGIKWYHDLVTPGQSSLPLTTEEFDQIVTRVLGIKSTQCGAQTKAVTP
ncbi:hypothetical protein [Pseudomonas cremoris]|uniref:hypothetical protein n=1 Tax=Pseudomonas cremoris TaxID=2724178 RepID=UPI001E5F34FD|nr:hypothetical protein [Pseudomonas cremoris]